MRVLYFLNSITTMFLCGKPHINMLQAYIAWLSSVIRARYIWVQKWWLGVKWSREETMNYRWEFEQADHYTHMYNCLWEYNLLLWTQCDMKLMFQDYITNSYSILVVMNMSVLNFYCASHSLYKILTLNN